MKLKNISWHERQEINESTLNKLSNGDTNQRIKKIKEKHNLTNKDLVEVFKENRKIMPNPKDWL